MNKLNSINLTLSLYEICLFGSTSSHVNTATKEAEKNCVLEYRLTSDVAKSNMLVIR